MTHSDLQASGVSLGLPGGGKVGSATVPPCVPLRRRTHHSLTFSTCCLMSEGITRIITTPSTAHNSPTMPSPTATQRALALPPMSACAARARGAQGLKGTETEATEATEMTEAEAHVSAR